MNPIDLLQTGPLGPKLAACLVHSAWQGTLVAGILAVALRAMRSAPARHRYAAGCLALLAIALLPIVTFGWQSSVERSARGLGWVSAFPAPRWESWLVLGWITGVAVLSIRLAGGLWHAGRLRSRDALLLGSPWRDRIVVLGNRLGVRKTPELLESGRVTVPTVVGWLRPAILVPAGLVVGMPPAQVDALLLHELAHILRNDFAVNLAQRLVETVLFYHPAVWWVSGCIRSERELCCDDLATAVLGEGRSLAGALLALAEAHTKPMDSTLTLAADGGSVTSRIRRLVGVPDPASAPWSPARRKWMFATVPLLAALIGLGTITFAPGLYQAHATLLVRPEPSEENATRNRDPLWLQSEMALIETAVLRRVADAYDQEQPGRLSAVPRDSRAALLRGRIRIAAPRGSSGDVAVMEVTVAAESGPDAVELAATFANRYQAFRLELRRDRRSAKEAALARDLLIAERRIEEAKLKIPSSGAPDQRRPANDDLEIFLEIRRDLKKRLLSLSNGDGGEDPVQIVDLSNSASPPRRWYSFASAAGFGSADSWVARVGP